MARLTASGTDRARECLFSFSDEAGPENVASSDAATGGQAEHANIESTIDEEAARAEAEALASETLERGHIAATLAAHDAEPEAKSDTHRRWLRDWWAHNRGFAWRAEEAFAINPFTGETRQAPESWPVRDYVWAPEGFVPGTADAWAIAPIPESPEAGICLRVPDWKTGLAAHVGDPAKSGQLHTLALAISRHIGWRGPVALEFVKVNGTRLWTERALVSRADLLAFQAELAALLRRTGQAPAPVRGPWCKSTFCGQRGRCEATRGFVAASVPALLAREPYRVALTEAGFVSDEHAAWQYAALDAADALLKEARAALKARARARRVPLGGGKFYGEVEATSDAFKLDAPGFDAALAKALGSHAAGVVETKRVAAKGRIEDAARALVKERKAAGEGGPRTVIAKVYAAALAELRSCGGLRSTPYRKLEVYAEKVAVGAKFAPEREVPEPERWTDVDLGGPIDLPSPEELGRP